MISDTSPDAERVQIELIRKASVAERIAVARSLTQMATHLSRRAIAELNPHASERDVALQWAELHYGKYLTDQVREYLKCRTN